MLSDLEKGLSVQDCCVLRGYGTNVRTENSEIKNRQM